MSDEPSSLERFDLIIVGSGQGGTYLAGKAAEAGWTVALVERDALGGSCVNYGCTPSKTLLASAHLAGRIRRGGDLCVTASPTVDVAGVMRRVRSVRDQWRDGVRSVCETEGLHVVRGEGRFEAGEGPAEGSGDHPLRRVRVGERLLGAERVLLDTGTRPLVPPVDGLAGTPFLTNETVFDLEALPRHLVVLGGGYVGLELSQGFARLGGDAIRVTVVERHERPLSTESEAVGACLRESLEADGVRFVVDSELTAARHDGTAFRLEIASRVGPRHTLDADALLIAAGRRPNVEALDLDAVGVDLADDGTIAIDDRYRTSAEGIFAIGEVAGRPAFTHVSTEDGRRLEALWDLGQRGRGGESTERTRDDRTLTYGAFTDPQLGRVGLSAEQAREAGRSIRCVHKALDETSRGIEWGRTRGFFEIVADADDGRLLGATFVGDEAAELVQLLLPAVDHGLTAAQLARSTFIHPTFSEDVRGLLFDLADQ